MINNGISKLILVVLNVIIILILIVSILKGISITEDISILSYKDIQTEKANYKLLVDSYNNLRNNDYSKAIKNLENEKINYETSKQKYEQIRSVNSYGDLVKLTQNKEYNIEFLWVKLDLKAKNNNLKAKFDIGPADNYTNYDINVTLQGDYLSIKNYIYDILIDMDLQFKSENITIEPKGDVVEATFTISNIKVIM